MSASDARSVQRRLDDLEVRLAEQEKQMSAIMTVVHDRFLPQQKKDVKIPMLAADPLSTLAPTKNELSKWTDGAFSPEIILFDTTNRGARVQKAIELARQRDRPVVVFLAKSTSRTSDAFDVHAVRELRKEAPDIPVVFLQVQRGYGIIPFEIDAFRLLTRENISVSDTDFVVLNITDGAPLDFKETQRGIALLKDL
jgi:uncharacterized coiled-coil protein SlyX